MLGLEIFRALLIFVRSGLFIDTMVIHFEWKAVIICSLEYF